MCCRDGVVTAATAWARCHNSRPRRCIQMSRRSDGKGAVQTGQKGDSSRDMRHSTHATCVQDGNSTCESLGGDAQSGKQQCRSTGISSSPSIVPHGVSIRKDSAAR